MRMEDSRMIRLFFLRDEAAIEAVAAKYGARLYSTANNIVHQHQDAEECVNDTYLALWKSIPPDKPNPLVAYAIRITRNIALKKLRDNHAQCRRSDYDLSLDELEGCIGSRSLEQEMDVRLLGQQINSFLATLRKENRILFLRRYYLGDSVKQIAKDRGMSENTVSVRLNRMRNQLKSFLIQEGYYEK